MCSMQHSAWYTYLQIIYKVHICKKIYFFILRTFDEHVYIYFVKLSDVESCGYEFIEQGVEWINIYMDTLT